MKRYITLYHLSRWDTNPYANAMSQFGYPIQTNPMAQYPGYMLDPTTGGSWATGYHMGGFGSSQEIRRHLDGGAESKYLGFLCYV